jgi:tetratricopeptide (TPR) repeat protein
MLKTLSTILVALLAVVNAFSQEKQTSLAALRAEGHEALYNLDYDTARKRFRKMIDLAPDDPLGAQCLAAGLWLQQMNELWKLKATLYSADASSGTNRAQAEEFRKWTRSAKLLSQARLRKNPRDVEALYYLGAAEGLEAVFAAVVERKYMAAFREGNDAVNHHRQVLKLAPDYHDAELTIGLQDYIIGSLPLPAKMLAGTMGVRGSKKRGLQTLERVSAEGQWAQDVARFFLIDLYKREKRWADAVQMARQLAEKYPRNYLFRLQMADALTSQIVTMRKAKTQTAAEEKELLNIFTSLSRDKTFDSPTRDLVNQRWDLARKEVGLH